MADSYIHIVLITGGNQGIGFEIAKKLATEHKDYHIILTARRPDALKNAIAKLNALGLQNLEPLVLDVASDESIAAAAKAVEEKHGRIDVLINNAAISTPGEAKSFPRDMWLNIYNVNVVGVAQMTDAFMPLLEKSKGVKRIVNITSNLGSLQDKADPTEFAHKLEYSSYAVTKAALNLLTLHYVARYEDDSTWKINLVCPGLCSTNLNNFLEIGEDPANGAIAACQMATLGIDGPTGTWIDRHRPRRW